MNRFYVACDFGTEAGRILLGTLHPDHLTVSEVRKFANTPVSDKKSLTWNVPQLYQEVMAALKEISGYEEPINSISATAWGADYMLFESDGTLVTPTFHYNDPRTAAGMKEVLSKISWEEIYDETGTHKLPGNTLFQLGAEKSKRFKQTRLLPIADAFNYLFSGVAKVEMSSASTTQLFNPATRAWSNKIVTALRLPSELLPPIVPAGTRLGPMRPEVLKETRLEDVQVVATCSHDIAASLVGLPTSPDESWTFLRLGKTSLMGANLVGPIINEGSRQSNFTNELGYNGSTQFYHEVAGLWILDECKRYWREHDRELYDDLLTHLAVAAPPFESLIDPSDARFSAPGDMPLKIQAFCKETDQAVPRKPGPLLRCVLESLALLYRRTLQAMEAQTGRKFSRLFILGGPPSNLLYHFISNALQIPVAIVPPDATAVGNVIAQAVALGHIPTIQQARQLVQSRFKIETIMPHTGVWNAAYDRLSGLVPAPAATPDKAPA